MRRLLDAAVSRRYLVLSVAGGCLWGAKLWRSGGESGDWVLFVHAARSISQVSSVGVFFGPLMLVLAKPFTHLSLTTGWVVMSGLCLVMALLTIRWAEDLGAAVSPASQQARERVTLLGGALVLYGLAEPGVSWGHPEDVFALAAVVLCLRAVARDNWTGAALSLAVAIDFKSWAVLALPLAAARAGARLRGLALVAGAVFLSWLPFLLIHHGSLDTTPILPPIQAWSGPAVLGGAVGASPDWPRDAQVATALALGAMALRRGRWELVPILAFAVRINLDPAVFVYYGAGALVGAFVWDIVSPGRVPALRTLAVCTALFVIPNDLGTLTLSSTWRPAIEAALRLLVLLAGMAALAARGYAAKNSSTS